MDTKYKKTARKSTADIALGFLKAHPTWFLFPIAAGAKLPPCIENNLNLASNDPKVIATWAKQFPGCNWGLALRKSRVIAVDVDTKPGKVGATTLSNLELEYGDLPPTLTVRTPSGGLHYYFAGEHVFALGKSGFGPDVDSPNYVLIRGCTLDNGGEYVVIANSRVAPAPDWFGIFLKPKAEKQAANAEAAVDLDQPGNVARMIDYLTKGAPPSIGGCGGDKALFDVACVLKDNGISEYRAVELLAEHYNVAPVYDELSGEAIRPYCDPLWSVGNGADADRLDIKVHNVYQYATESAVGSGTAEAHFRDDLYSVDDMKEWTARMNAAFAKNEPARKAACERIAKAKAVEAFADDTSRPETEAEAKERIARTAERRRRKEKSAERETLESLLAGWCYVGQQKRFVRKRDGMLWEAAAFNPFFSDIEVIGKNNNTSLGNYLLSRRRGSEHAIQKFDTFCYLPGEGENVGGAYNQYVASEIKPKEGGTEIWDSHLEYLFPEQADRDLVLNWLAWVLQNLDKKPKHALFIRGETQGTGKSFIGDVLTELIGPRNVSPIDQGDFETPHNGWQLMTKLTICEEVRSLSLGASRRLFGWLTQGRLKINEKNMPQCVIPDVIAYLFFSNKMDALPIDDTDRRYLIVATNAKPKGKPYYCRLFDVLDDPVALAAIKHQLMRRKLGSYTAAGSAPYTAAKGDMIEESATDLQSFMTMRAGSEPFNFSLVTVDEVIEKIPPRYLPHTRKVATVRDALRRRFYGAPIPFPIQTGARKSESSRVWAIGQDEAAVAAVAKLKWSDLSALYQREHSTSRVRADASAADDFGEGE